MYRFLSLLLYTCSVLAQEPIRVAVIDTGLNLDDPRFSYLLCDQGLSSKDFTETTLNDKNDHGTHVVGLIKQYAKDSNYCLIIVKFYDDTDVSWLHQSIEYAIEQKADIINISAGGKMFIQREYDLIKNSPKIKFIAAAGNEGEHIDCNEKAYYPACYKLDNVISVGCSDCQSTNYGEVIKAWEKGNNVKSTFPFKKVCDLKNKNCGEGYMTGTSQATAIHTGKVIYENNRKR